MFFLVFKKKQSIEKLILSSCFVSKRTRSKRYPLNDIVGQENIRLPELEQAGTKIKKILT